MNKRDLIALYNKELRKEIQIQGFIREQTEHVVRYISQFEEKSYILFSNVTKENGRDIIKRELAYFRELKKDFEWKVYSFDKPSNLKEMLKQEGFTIEEREALMVLKLDEHHPLITNVELENVKEIVDEEGIQKIIELENAVWNESFADLGERLWRDKQSEPGHLFLYGIYDKDQLVSAAWMYLEKNTSFASLWGGSTLPKYRGKGYYTNLLAARARKAYEKGHPFLTVEASEMSRPILEKYGFQCLGYTYGCQSPHYQEFK